jgi:shikimate kinase
MNNDTRIALTGFMGVGKSSVARHLANMLRCERLDLDNYIEKQEQRKISEIIDTDGVEKYRTIETKNLEHALGQATARIFSLGGGTWTVSENRELLKTHGFTTVWLESTFEHCWLNISFSRKDRPLARNKEAALKLFEERQKVYCLANWHFIVRPGLTSYDVAKRIVDEIFS